jgi:hypothetical protein
MPQAPQWFALVARSVQTPSQLAPPGQVTVQEPLEQAVPSWQTWSVAPQLLESEARFTQAVAGPSAVKD